MTILGLAESFKTMNQPGPTGTLFDRLFIEKCRRLGSQYLFKSSICAIKIWNRYFDSLESMNFSATL